VTAPKGALRVKCQGPGCGKSFWAKSTRQKFCGSSCRARSYRRGPAERDSELVKAVRAELRKASKLASVQGQVAVKIASQLDAAGPSQVASLSRELDRVMRQVLGPDAPAPAATGESAPAEEQDDEVTSARKRAAEKAAAMAAGQ
jgi:hypothetical protein